MPKQSRGLSDQHLISEICQRVRWAREMLIPNRAEAARVLRMDNTSLLKIEKGERAPTILQIVAMVSRFRLSADYFLMGELTGAEDRVTALRLVALHPALAPKDSRSRWSSTDTEPI